MNTDQTIGALEEVAVKGSYSVERARARARWIERAPRHSQTLEETIENTAINIHGNERARTIGDVTDACAKAASENMNVKWTETNDGQQPSWGTQQRLKKIALDRAQEWCEERLNTQKWRETLGRCNTRTQYTRCTTICAGRIGELGQCEGVPWREIAKAPPWARETAVLEIEVGMLTGRWTDWIASWANERCAKTYSIDGIATNKTVAHALANWRGKRVPAPLERIGLGATPLEDDPEGWWSAAVRRQPQTSETNRAEILERVEHEAREERGQIAAQVKRQAMTWCGGHNAESKTRLKRVREEWSTTKGLPKGDWMQGMRLIEIKGLKMGWEIPYIGPEPVLAASITGKGASAEIALNRALIWPLTEDEFGIEGWNTVPRFEGIDRKIGDRLRAALVKAHAA